MTNKRSFQRDLRQAILDPGFTPRETDAGALLDAIAEGGEDARPAERALLRLGPKLVAPTVARTRAERPAERAAALRLLGRMPAHSADPAVEQALVGGLEDADERVRRAAASALGRARPPGAETALAEAIRQERAASARHAMVEALGKVGSEAALETLRGAEAEMARTGMRATLMVTRTAARAIPSRICSDRPAEGPVWVALRCRAGLETLLASELPSAFETHSATGGLVEGRWRGAPLELYRARTFLSLAFPLPMVPTKGDDPGEAILTSLTSPEARSILRRWTEGPLRFRLSFRGGGKRRAMVWQIATAMAARAPELVNDPTESPWEAVVIETRGHVRIELVPNVVDPRFTYRKRDVPAASHPTIAAALVRIAGAQAGDTVWDPFLGSGTELCERAIAGRYQHLVGSDHDPHAIEVARINLEATGVKDATLMIGDATSLHPPGPPPTLIVTNPPLGRRVQRGAGLGPLLERFVSHAAALLTKGGRLVWISPFPARTRAVAEARGLSLAEAREVDLGGFAAELQHWRKR